MRRPRIGRKKVVWLAVLLALAAADWVGEVRAQGTVTLGANRSSDDDAAGDAADDGVDEADDLPERNAASGGEGMRRRGGGRGGTDLETGGYLAAENDESFGLSGRSSSGVVSRRLRPSTVPSVYTVRRGDTLWDITGHFYGNPYHWPKVWSYNPEITNPHWIYPTDHLRLRAEGDEPATLPGSGTASVRPASVPGSVYLRDQGYLDRDALQDAGIIIGSPEENMLLSTFDDVYVRFQQGAEVRPGRDYTIYREIDLDEERDQEGGVLVRILGVVRVHDYDDDRQMGRGTISEALDPIERGFHLAPIPRRFDMVPPRENARDVVAKVVASLEPRRLSSNAQIIFVDKGAEDGVQLGNRFLIIRQGDQWRAADEVGDATYGETVPEAPEPQEDEYLPEAVAEGRVVNVRPRTSALFITGSTDAVVLGDRAEMRRGF